MKLTSRLQIGFALPTVFIVVLGIGSVIGFNLINKKVATIYDDRVVPLKQLKEISDDYAIFIIDAVNKADDKLISSNQALTGITKAQERIKKTWGEYIQTYLTPEEAALAGEVEKAFIPANNMLNALVSDLKRGNDQELGKYDGQLYSVIDPVTERIQKLIDLQLDVAQQERNKASEIFNVILWTFIVTSIVLIILVLGPIRIIISKGLIGTVKETINVMASASTEIAASTEEQERLAERQYSSVNRTTTTMDELQASSQQSAQQAETAATGAQQVLTLSENGKYAVRESLEGMSELKDKVVDIAQSITQLSEQIGQINTYQQLVGDIANQTNMLALNAAVEAVRAGEHGKGFSVVATEIRKLADQSKQSADKINQLVSDIQGAINTTVMVTESGTKTVQKGVDIAEKTASTFNNVAQSIEEVVVNLKQISLNVKQQAIAVTEVVGEMNTLNQAANQSATGISQTKIGTQKLSETALNLQEMV